MLSAVHPFSPQLKSTDAVSHSTTMLPLVPLPTKINRTAAKLKLL